MPLSHVLMWTEEHGYRRVTPDEATLLYPEKVSALVVFLSVKYARKE